MEEQELQQAADELQQLEFINSSSWVKFREINEVAKRYNDLVGSNCKKDLDDFYDYSYKAIYQKSKKEFNETKRRLKETIEYLLSYPR